MAIINGQTIQGIAIGGTVTKGMAAMGDIVHNDTLPLIFGEIDIPGTVYQRVLTTFRVRTNRNAGHVVAFRVDNGTGIPRSNTTIADLADGTREISFDMSFGTAGNTSVRLVPAVSSANNMNDKSEIIINFRVVKA